MRKKNLQKEHSPIITSHKTELNPDYPDRFHLSSIAFQLAIKRKANQQQSTVSAVIREIWPNISEEELSALVSNRMNPVPQWLGIKLLEAFGPIIFINKTKEQLPTQKKASQTLPHTPP